MNRQSTRLATSFEVEPEASVATTITVLYENVDDATFDLDYYVAKHMPLVDEKFRPFGIKGWRVL